MYTEINVDLKDECPLQFGVNKNFSRSTSSEQNLLMPNVIRIHLTFF
jgi:hypothetical protein